MPRIENMQDEMSGLACVTLKVSSTLGLTASCSEYMQEDTEEAFLHVYHHRP